MMGYRLLLGLRLSVFQIGMVKVNHVMSQIGRKIHLLVGNFTSKIFCSTDLGHYRLLLGLRSSL